MADCEHAGLGHAAVSSTLAPPPLKGAAVPDERVRYHHLDAVRAFALLLGVFFHAAESFGPRNTYWAIVDCSTSGFLEWFRFACHSFRLELFFVIAGFFARLVILRRGTAGFTWNRFQRILVPLVVGWAILYPLMASIWIWGWSVSGQLAQAGVPPEFQQLPVWKLSVGFFISGTFLKKLDLTHLWFLHQLLAIYVLILGVRWLTRNLDRTGSWVARSDRWFGKINASPAAFLWFALPTIPMMLMMDSWVVDTPKESLFPHLPTTIFFGFCFLAGWFWHRQPLLLETLARRWGWHMAVGLLLWIAFGLLNKGSTYRGLNHEQLQWVRRIFATCYSLMMWAFVYGFIGLFTRSCQELSSWRRYVADASYWIYIVHLPLVVSLQVLLGRVAIPWPIKYPIICAIALGLLFTSYHYLVRGTFIGAQLNGRRYPLVWPWKTSRS